MPYCTRVRFGLHSGLVIALLMSFSQAPNDHFHPGDSDHDHDHEFETHAFEHLVDEHNGPVLKVPDHDSTAKLKDWLAGDGSVPSKQYVVTPSIVIAQQLVVLERSVAVVSLKNHDPPSRRTRSARAPPTPAYS